MSNLLQKPASYVKYALKLQLGMDVRIKVLDEGGWLRLEAAY